MPGRIRKKRSRRLKAPRRTPPTCALMTSKPETRTITAGLAMLTGHGSSVTPYGVVMAGALISALPLLIVFFFVQKRFVEGIAMTGMK